MVVLPPPMPMAVIYHVETGSCIMLHVTANDEIVVLSTKLKKKESGNKIRLCKNCPISLVRIETLVLQGGIQSNV